MVKLDLQGLQEKNESRESTKPPCTGMTALLRAGEKPIHLHNQVKKVLKKTTKCLKGQEQLSLQEKKTKNQAIPKTWEAF